MTAMYLLTNETTPFIISAPHPRYQRIIIAGMATASDDKDDDD